MTDIARIERGIAVARERGDEKAAAILEGVLAREQEREAAKSRVSMRLREDPAGSAAREEQQAEVALDEDRILNGIKIAIDRGDERSATILQGVMNRAKKRTKAAGVYYDEPSGTVADPREETPRYADALRGGASGLASMAGSLFDVVRDPQGLQMAQRVATGQPMFPSANRARRALGDYGRVSMLEVPEENRPAFAFGETLASGLALVPAVRGLQLAEGATAAGRIAAPAMVQEASALGSALGAGVAEASDPGDSGTRLGAEVAGGLFHPSYLATRIGAGYAPTIAAKAKELVGVVKNPAMRENVAAKALVSQIKHFGEDPQAVLSAAKAAQAAKGSKFTADIETGSDALVAMRNHLAQDHPGFKKAFTERNLAEIQRLAAEARAAATSGTPDAMRESAAAYERMFDDILTKYREGAEQRAAEVAAKLGKDPAEQARMAGKLSAKVNDEAWNAARKFESSLWEALPQDIKLEGKATMAAYRSSHRDMLPGEEPFDQVIGNFITEYVSDGIATSGNMLTLRQRLLEKSREAMAASKRDTARRYGELADAVLDDLADVPGSEAARAASRAKHDAFTRTFAGESGLTVQRSGAERVNPETLAARATAGGAGGVERLVKTKELREAAGFDPRAAGLDVPEDMTELSPQAITTRKATAQEAIEQQATADIARTVDPITGRVSEKPLAKGLRDIQSMDVPKTQAAGTAALESELAAKRATERTSELTRRLRSRGESAIARVTNDSGASTAKIVGKAIDRGDAGAEYTRLATMAGSRRLPQKARDAAMDDLRAGSIAHVVDKSTKDGELSFVALREQLLKPQATGKPALIDMMERNGVIGGDHALRLRQMVTKGALAETAMTKGGAGVADVAAPSMALSVLTKVIGARAGSLVSKVLPGPGNIQTPGYGAKFAQWLLNKAPQYNINEVLKHAMLDNDFLVMMLERPAAQDAMKLTKLQRIRFKRVTAGLMQAGLMPKEEYEELNDDQ